MIASAEASYMDSIRNATELAAQAAVSRTLADAEYQFAMFQSDDMRTRAGIAAETRMAQASAEAQFAIADAKDQSVRAAFDARIAQTQAERNRALANQYLAQQQRNAAVQQAIAAAAAYRDMSSEAIAKLNDRATTFALTAQDNWDERLAVLPEFPGAASGDEVYEQIIASLKQAQTKWTLPSTGAFNSSTFSTPGGSSITNVPVEIDN